jgi:hypothetical protein
VQSERSEQRATSNEVWPVVLLVLLAAGESWRWRGEQRGKCTFLQEEVAYLVA